MRRMLTASLLVFAATVGLATTVKADVGPVCFKDDVAVHLLATGQWRISYRVLCIVGYTGVEQVEHPTP